MVPRQARPASRLFRFLAGIGIALAVTLAGIGFYLWTWQPDPRLYPVRGIDVSHHQGAIDWPAVAGDGIRFAYLKASEGGDYVDPDFAANNAAAHAAGIRFGAYHFFTFCRPGSDQARHFLAVLRAGDASDVTPTVLPPVVDLEFGGNCGARPAPAALQAELTRFLEIVEGELGQKAMFYTTDDFDAAYGAVLLPRLRWRRSLFRLPAEPGWVFWQYHNAGHVAGISGRIDLDVYCGDEERWRAAPIRSCDD